MANITADGKVIITPRGFNELVTYRAKKIVATTKCTKKVALAQATEYFKKQYEVR